MAKDQAITAAIFNVNLRVRTAGLVSFAALAAILTIVPVAQAQTFTLLHTFMGPPDGASPASGLAADAAGNLYGTTEYGGNTMHCDFSCGTVYRVARSGSGWITSTIYKFMDGADGANPIGRVIFGPDGALYGTTTMGGSGSCEIGSQGCGTVFKLQPPATYCHSFVCPWRETILYSFTGGADGEYPAAEVTFDQEGNLYGTTGAGGTGPCNYGSYGGCGTVFRLTHNPDGTWSKSTLYSFQGGSSDGISPAALVLDPAGNIYGTAGGGLPCVNGGDCGVVFELTPSASGWTETLLHIFTDGADGAYPASGLILDNQGNLWDATSSGPGEFGVGTIFELTPAQGGWNFTTQYTFINGTVNGANAVTMDSAGNIYGSSFGGGANGTGVVYELTRTNGGWSYSAIFSFPGDGSDGFFPEGNVLLDSQGNIYGTASHGPYPSPDVGTVWKVTP